MDAAPFKHPWTASASQRNKIQPLLHSLQSFLMEMTAPCIDNHTQMHAHTVVGTGQDWVLQRRRLTSENTSIQCRERRKMREPEAQAKSFFLPLFQGNMPKAIKAASSCWMEKADVPCSGLREVRAGGNAFRNTVGGMYFTVIQPLHLKAQGFALLHAT